MDFYPPLRKQDPSSGQSLIRWEYSAVTIEAKGIWDKNLGEQETVEELNRLGREGWEVVVGVPVSRTGIWTGKEGTYAFSFILKRQLTE